MFRIRTGKHLGRTLSAIAHRSHAFPGIIRRMASPRPRFDGNALPRHADFMTLEDCRKSYNSVVPQGRMEPEYYILRMLKHNARNP
ncbi:hypothetical protein Geu3261_0081_014 [Komagataeibacter europaeus NBRC 3261]|uniref:Uncharacterized protein n=1 Tax=Komagataeibacter europaeus NBRC 3261 TaxID=1234669 RepID=A0A0D6PZ46_KOMEU|nr:hypothetical protein [Komagataeibacter europaeus]GAN96597.1 hypothetical protein Geu3261_0081_014 [Komagataeibacter europaeus NBRC 3261]